MAIKWSDIKLGTSPLTNSIFIGRTKVGKNGMEEWTDRSEDMKQDILKAVLEWFMLRYKFENKTSIELITNGKRYMLTYSEEDCDEEQGEPL